MSFYKIISEEVLENLVCSNCDNYLSYGEATIGSTQMRCGRCNQAEGILPLFNETITNYLFPCINRFDNCKELLQYSQVQEHEKTCKSSKHTCCECEYIGNGCQLYHHFKKKHPDHILKYPIFNIYLLEEKTWNYLYRINNNLFLITYQIIKPDCVLKVSARSIGDSAEIPSSQIVLKSFTKDQQFLTSAFKSATDEELDILKHIEKHKENRITCHFNVKVSSELFILKKATESNVTATPSTNQLSMEHETQTEQNDDELQQITNALNKNLFPKLICSNCTCYVIPPIYKCPLNHVRCEECSSSFCNSCSDIVNWSRATDLEVFHNVIPFPCRWNCKQMLPHSDLRAHEKMCSERRYKCVEEWCSWSGTLDNLIQHWHSSTQIYNNTHEVYGFHESLVEFYLTYDYELFYCRMDPLKAHGRNIHIRKVSQVSPKSQVYWAKILLTHRCDDVLLQEAVSIKLGGVTLLENSLFKSFGQCKNYKIIFSISPNVRSFASRRWRLRREVESRGGAYRRGFAAFASRRASPRQ